MKSDTRGGQPVLHGRSCNAVKGTHIGGARSAGSASGSVTPPHRKQNSCSLVPSPKATTVPRVLQTVNQPNNYTSWQIDAVGNWLHFFFFPLLLLFLFNLPIRASGLFQFRINFWKRKYFWTYGITHWIDPIYVFVSYSFSAIDSITLPVVQSIQRQMTGRLMNDEF